MDPPKLDPLPSSFYDRPVLGLARALVGKILVHATPDGIAAGRIVETEAYRGPEDLAAHSANGRRTKRTEAMFGPAGRAYMFLLYGTSWAFNVTAGALDHPHAVLVRALEPLVGHDLMARRRSLTPERRELTNGPGKLCQALALDRSHYGACLVSSPLFISDGISGKVGRSPRINIDYAGVWAQRDWRFYERDNRYVSVAPRS
ncbi:MAG: DNA-3-methyladenine glycosylase [Polyangiaceae bacterium]|nr:DNA-3-methyladenine glycosylase [Polyangiaceae bacterium]